MSWSIRSIVRTDRRGESGRRNRCDGCLRWRIKSLRVFTERVDGRREVGWPDHRIMIPVKGKYETDKNWVR